MVKLFDHTIIVDLKPKSSFFTSRNGKLPSNFRAWRKTLRPAQTRPPRCADQTQKTAILEGNLINLLLWPLLTKGSRQ